MLTKHQEIIIITLFISSLFYSCASFTKKRFRTEIVNLEKDNLNNISGNYALSPSKKYYSRDKDIPSNKIPDSSAKNNAYSFLINETYVNKKAFDSLQKSNNKYLLKLNLESSKKISIKLLENSKVIMDTIFEGKLKNGMFYIDNRYTDCNGVPFIFGGCRNEKRRIGLTRNGDLLINQAVSDAGAFLLIFGVGYNYNLTYQYQRK